MDPIPSMMALTVARALALPCVCVMCVSVCVVCVCVCVCVCACPCRVCQSLIDAREGCVLASCVGLARTIHERCIYGIFGRGNHQIYGHIRCINTVLANPHH